MKLIKGFVLIHGLCVFCNSYKKIINSVEFQFVYNRYNTNLNAIETAVSLLLILGAFLMYMEKRLGFQVVSFVYKILILYSISCILYILLYLRLSIQENFLSLIIIVVVMMIFYLMVLKIDKHLKSRS